MSDRAPVADAAPASPKQLDGRLAAALTLWGRRFTVQSGTRLYAKDPNRFHDLWDRMEHEQRR